MTQELVKQHSWKSAWKGLDATEKENVFVVGDKYKAFLDAGKTERLATREIIRQAKAAGFEDLNEWIAAGKKPEAGVKLFAENKDKSVALFVMGTEATSAGMTVIGSHLDAPRLDVKPFPLYEDTGLGLMKTHYYGGVKKYQWTTIPLALHGVVFNKEGKKINIAIGDRPEDPVLFITDLLIHLSKDQMGKKLAEGITGEELNVVMGSIPLETEEEKQLIKQNILQILKAEYDMEELDFTTAELEIVPAGQARDVGLDRGMIAAYGHDDRVCAFTTLQAILEIDAPTKTAVGLFMDKEEIGNTGNTGADSRFFEDTVAEVIALQEDYSDLKVRRAFRKTEVLSADVGAALDPTFPSVHDKRNAAVVGNGVQLVKYTGARGKAGCNDANAEFVSKVRGILDDAGIVWQVGELGKIDQGGGGTFAYALAQLGAEAVDMGVPVLGMHSPYELVSKVDVYMTYKAYKAFMNR